MSKKLSLPKQFLHTFGDSIKQDFMNIPSGLIY